MISALARHVLSLVLLLLPAPGCWSKTMRYRQGALSTTDDDDRVLKHYITPITVAEIREECRSVPSCVTFSYYSETTRFPSGAVDWAYLYPYADYHFREDEFPSFVDGLEWEGWHTYINTTREKGLVVDEVESILGKLKSIGMKKRLDQPANAGTPTTTTSSSNNGSRLRGGNGSSTSRSKSQKDASLNEDEQDGASSIDEEDERKLLLLSYLFEVISRKAHKAIAAPHIIPYVLQLATSRDEIEEVRINSMRVLIVLGDAPETGPTLVEAGVYNQMKKICDERERINDDDGDESSWGDVAKSALDVISNMILYRSANSKLRRLGAHTFLRDLLSETPPKVALQATLALTHFDDVSLDSALLPVQNLKDLVKLLASAVEQDVVYDIMWDLIPGPLSAVKHLLEASGSEFVRDTLLDSGLMEQLLKILEDSGEYKAEEVVCALEVALMLVRSSERARHMILLAEHTVQEVEERLLKYDRAARLAGGLLEAATTNGRGAEL